MPFRCRLVARGQKDFGNRIREPVPAQMDDWVNVTKLKNRSLQVWRLEKRRGKAALIWPCRRVTIFALHSYPLSPARAGLSFFRTVRRTTHESDIRIQRARSGGISVTAQRLVTVAARESLCHR